MLGLAGPPAGCVLVQVVPVKFIKYFLREIGLPKYGGIHPSEVFGCLFTTRLEADSRRQTAMKQFGASSAQKKHNRDLHKKRWKCAGAKPVFCDKCPFGTDSCLMAVRTWSYVKRYCESGHMAYFKPDSDARFCARCQKKYMEKEKESKGAARG